MTLPWAPLFTINRSNRPEITVHGIIHVCHGDTDTLLSVGESEFPLWSRSLIKPWQLAVLLPELLQAFPGLKPSHVALMLSSHSGELMHTNTLIAMLGHAGLNESHLSCPACYPLSGQAQHSLKARGEHPQAIYHPCSGKHIAMLLYQASHQHPIEAYLSPDNPLYQALKDLVTILLNRPSNVFEETLDGCGMPNIALSAQDMARLYRGLAAENPTEGQDIPAEPHLLMRQSLATLRDVMTDYPQMVGGTGRLDSRLLSGELTAKLDVKPIAKEGADGLLGVGIPPCDPYPQGVGIFIKLACGYEPRYLEILITEILSQLGLLSKTPVDAPTPEPLQTEFHFQCPIRQAAASRSC